VDHFCADNTKAKRLLSWNPSISLQDGIGQLIQEYKNDPLKSPQDSLKIGFIGQGWI
jgi:dTDP-D-glucose 4,6-dehydratase